MRARRVIVQGLLCLFFAAQFLPGAAAAVEPDPFDGGPENAAVAVRVKTVPGRALEPARRDSRRGDRAANVAPKKQTLAAVRPAPPSPIATLTLPRRSPSGDRSSKTPSEDH